MPHRGVLVDDCQDSSNRSLLSSGLWPFVASVNSHEVLSSDTSSALLRYMLSGGGSGAAGLFDGGWELGSPDSMLSLHKFLPSNCEGEGVGEEELFSSSLPCDLYSTDEFRMFEFKVRRCVRWRSHDWTECPFAHPGEKARRRDPRAPPHYSGTACPDFRKGSCKRGDGCEFAHGVFECWLHPQRYRTHLCKDGKACRRRVCFFAHTPDQLRAPASDEAVDAAPDESSSSSIHGPRHATFVAMSSLPDWSSSPIAPLPYHRKPLVPLTLTDAATSPPRADMTPASIHGPRHGSVLASSPPKSPNSPFDWPNSPSSQVDAAFARGPCPSTIIALSSPKSPNSPLDWPDTSPSHCAKHLNGNADMVPSLLGSSSTCCTALPSQSLPDHDRNGHLWHNMEDLACSNPIITFQPSPTEAPKMRYFSGPSLIRTDPGSLWNPSSEEGLDPPLQRVESGRGIRAEIFENLLKKNQQNSIESGLHLGWVDDLVKDT